MGQSCSASSKAGDKDVASTKKRRSLRILKISRSRSHKTSKVNNFNPSAAQPPNAVKMAPEADKHPDDGDEKMEGVQFESPQPASQPNQPKPRRRRGVEKKRVILEIKEQDRDDAHAYTAESMSIYDLAKNEPTFTGDCFYYFLNKRKVLDQIHGTYIIVYARPLIAEQDRYGTVVCEVFEPDIKNTLCIYTRNIPDRSSGHRKVNELLESGFFAVGMLHFRSRSLVLRMTPDIFDQNTAASTQAEPGKSSGQVAEASGPFDETLRDAATTTKDTRATLTFGAKIMQELKDFNTGYMQNWGFEFATLEFPTMNSRGEQEPYICVAVKIPDKQDVASRFILHQKLRCPFNKLDLMSSFLPADVEYKPWFPAKKLKISPYAQNPFKAAGGVNITLPPLLPKPAASSSSAAFEDRTYNRWAAARENEFDIVVDETDEAAGSDAETVTG